MTYKPTGEQKMRFSDFVPNGMTENEMLIIISVAVILIVVGGIILALKPRKGMSARVRALNLRREELKSELLSTKRRRGKGIKKHVHWIREFVDRFKLLKNKQSSQIQQLLIEAGLRSKDALVIYTFLTIVLPIAGLIIGIIFLQFYTFPVKLAVMNKAFPLFTMYFGMKLPMIVVKKKRKKRYLKLQRSLSDTLDLMTICAEAGLSLGSALARVSKELGLAYPEMAEELSFTALEMGFLPDRNKALLNLAQRASLDEIRGIVNVLVQTEKYGTPIAQALRVLASEFREQRMLRAENKAAKLPTMMTMPMMLFILPTLFIVIMSPAIIRASANWK